MAKETVKPNATSNVKPKIQAVVPPELLARYEAIVQSGDWDDKAAVMEALISAYEVQEYGRAYPARKKELDAVEAACAQIKGTVKYLIEAEAGADNKARAAVQSTLALLEKEAAKVPELEKRVAGVEKALEKAWADNAALEERAAEEADKRKEAEARLRETEEANKELQAQLNALRAEQAKGMESILERIAAKLDEAKE